MLHSVAARHKQPNSISFLQVADETFDVGVDLRSEINAKDYQVPFAFNGTIDRLVIKLGPSQVLPADEAKRVAAVGKTD